LSAGTANEKATPIGVAFSFDRGAGGIRTLVQTSNYIAFYMLSFHLDFRGLAGRKLPTHPLALLELHKSIKALLLLGLLLRSHYVNRRKPRPLSDFLLAHLVGRGTSYYDSDYAARA